MSHKEFVLAYENGRLSCRVSVLLTLRLFFAGDIREKKVSINLSRWSLGFVVLISEAVIWFFNVPIRWALLGTITMLVIYALGFFYSAVEIVLSAALADEEFYEFAKAKRALSIYSDDEILS